MRTRYLNAIWNFGVRFGGTFGYNPRSVCSLGAALQFSTQNLVNINYHVAPGEHMVPGPFNSVFCVCSNIAPTLALLPYILLFQIDTDCTEKCVSISNYPLSAALTCAKVCSAFEEQWGVC
jgi:hypothetical protein